MVVLKDIQNNQVNMDAMKTYKSFNKETVKIDYTPQPIEPMKSTTNLILDLNTKSLKNAPIMDSDKKPAPTIRPYDKFKGAQALPTFNRDLKSGWHIC
jgi:hypothetical protein